MRAIDVLHIPGVFGMRSSCLGLILLIILTIGCGPDSGTQGSSGPSGDAPELTEQLINERINEVRVWDVPEENGNGKEIVWNFDEDEPKEIKVVERQDDGNKATIVLDIRTMSSPRAREPRYLAGQIRTEWELRTGWALRRWEITDVENISMKYKNTPKPPEQNSNREPERPEQGNRQ